MMGFLTRLVAVTLAVLAAEYLFKGSIVVADWQSAVLVALVLSLLNMFVRPILILLTLPFNLITLGLFTLVINAFLLLCTSWLLKTKFQVHGFMAAFWGSLVISIVSSLIHWIIKPKKHEEAR